MSLTYKNILIFINAFFFIFIVNIYSRENPGEGGTELYRKAMDALKSNDTTKAEKLFTESTRKHGDAGSYYELGKINLKRNTLLTRSKALENFRRAVWKDPGNIEYRYAFASLMKDFARRSSFNEFKKIISMDSSQVQAWLSLGTFKDEEFTEYNKSVRKMSDEFYGSLQEYADKDFYEAETYYLTALKNDSLNYDAILKLSLLYDKAGKPESGIPLLKKLVNAQKGDKDIHLCLGLLNYKTSKLKESYEEYKKAFLLMNEEEKNDFTFNTVKFLIKPAFEDVVDELGDYELKQFIETYWKVFDPLYLTEYNERLLEHYSRTAYANLHFGIPKMGKTGWKTDRGEVLLRYGEPLNFMRIRPSMGESGVNMKTEVWNYKDMSFGFTDMASSGNYIFSVPAFEKDKMRTQYGGDTQYFMEYLRKAHHTYYNPKFEGPKFDVQYSVAQFKSKEKRNHTDIYLNYKMDLPDSLFNEKVHTLKHKAGFFFFNNNYDEQYRRITEFEVRKDQGKNIVQCFETTMRSDSGFSSFEIIREVDKAVSANRSELKIRKFENINLDISDLLFATGISSDADDKYSMTREKLNIAVNPLNEFDISEQPFIYFEIYNLKKAANGLTDFEQKISIKEYEEEPTDDLGKAAKSVLGFLGFGKKEEITLTSNYQTFENDPHIYLQLDLSKYQTGKYQIIVTIKDRLENKEVTTQTIIELKR